MRLRLPLSLRSALLACSVLFTTVASASVSDGNLGNVMYIGDSITHGVNSGSWRWAMHKIFTDNGISYTEKGIMTDNFSGGVAAFPGLFHIKAVLPYNLFRGVPNACGHQAQGQRLLFRLQGKQLP